MKSLVLTAAKMQPSSAAAASAMSGPFVADGYVLRSSDSMRGGDYAMPTQMQLV